MMLLTGLILITAPAVQGLVIDPNNAYYGDGYKSWAKFRQDVGKQQAKITSCYTKALVKCIGSTDPNTTTAEWPSRCNAVDPNSSTTDTDTKATWKAALAKCDSKVDLAKKNPADPNGVIGYRDIGCPAEDPNWLATGMTDYQNKTMETTRASVQDVANSIPGSCDLFGAPSEGEDLQACLVAMGKAAEKTVKSVFKCQEKCENDLANKKGNGGPTDNQLTCSADAPPALPNPFTECVNKAVEKGRKLAQKNTAAGALWDSAMGITLPKLDDSTNDLYNECRCGSGIGPCPIVP